MPHIVHPDDNDHQPDRGERDRLDGRLIWLSESDPRQSSARAPHKGSRRSGK